MPLVASLSCLMISLYKDYDSVTHVVGRECRPDTKNFMCSISAAVGNKTPQQYIWRICIALMIHQRLMDGGVMHGYLRLEAAAQGIMKRGGGGGSFKLLNYANWGLHSLAQVCLLLLTNVSSSDNLPMHEGGFVGFLVFSMLHKATCVYLFRWAHWHDLERVPHIRCGGARTRGVH